LCLMSTTGPVSSTSEDYAALQFQAIALKARYKPGTRGATPFQRLSPVCTGDTSLKSPIITPSPASERCSCSASSAITLEDLPTTLQCLTTPRERLTARLQGTIAVLIGPYSELTHYICTLNWIDCTNALYSRYFMPRSTYNARNREYYNIRREELGKCKAYHISHNFLEI